jgi:superfamily I DNA/RNA helicase
MKGGECDNILVVPDLSYAAAGKLKRGGNVEHRVFYVAVTRAKKELHVMAPMTNQYYDL